MSSDDPSAATNFGRRHTRRAKGELWGTGLPQNANEQRGGLPVLGTLPTSRPPGTPVGRPPAPVRARHLAVCRRHQQPQHRRTPQMISSLRTVGRTISGVARLVIVLYCRLSVQIPHYRRGHPDFEACLFRGWDVAPFLPPHLSSGSHRAMTIGRATGAVPHPLALLTSSYSRLIRGLSPCREEADRCDGDSGTADSTKKII